MSLNIKIALWNCRSVNNKINDLLDCIRKYHIVRLQKTPLRDHHTLSFKVYHTIRKDRPGISQVGRVAILIYKDIVFEVNKINKIPIALKWNLAKIRLGDSTIHILNLHCPRNAIISSKQ